VRVRVLVAERHGQQALRHKRAPPAGTTAANLRTRLTRVLIHLSGASIMETVRVLHTVLFMTSAGKVQTAYG
jgi:hypothetical protein